MSRKPVTVIEPTIEAEVIVTKVELVSTTSLTQPSYTPQQIEILKWVVEGVGHAVVIARAGTGKTWTALKAIRLMLPSSVSIAQFNHDIAAETRGKLANDDIKAWSQTFHGAGWQALRNAYPSIKLSGVGPGKAGYDKWDKIVESLEMPKVYEAFAQKAMSMAKLRAFGVSGATPDLKHPSIVNHWLKLVEDFDLDELIAEENYELLATMGQTRDMVIKTGLRWAAKALNLSNENLEFVADFDDQIYGPLIKNVRMFENDWLIVDEAQDTNPARRLLARKMLKRNGRALWIGDPAQAIYAFTGADNDAMDVVIKEWKATVLKLTVTFRCPKLIVRMAKEFVPDYEAANDNIEGEYYTFKNEEFCVQTGAANTMKSLAPTTIVLCRNTAPLVRMAFKLIGAGIPCRVLGKEIGDQIVSLINRWKSVKTVTTFMDRLSAYLEKQTAKLLAAKKERQAESLNDRIETVFAIIEGMPAGSTLDAVKAKVDEMFPKEEKGVEKRKIVRLMTIHRAKGLEEDTIVILGRKELCPSKFAKRPEAIQQERNLEYVALTRTMRRLIDVKLPVAA